jgi:hypothetical protein
MIKEFHMKEGDLIGWLEFRHYVIDNDIEDAVVYCDDGKTIHLNRFAVPLDRDSWPEYDNKVNDLIGSLIVKQSEKRKKERRDKN